MKLLYPTPYFYPSVGGMEHHIYYLATGLIAKGFKISLLTSQHIQNLHIEEVIDGIHVKRFKPIAAPLRNPITPGMLGPLLHEECDIIHAHDEHSFASNLAAFAAKMRDKLFIQHLFGELPLFTPLEKLAGGIYMSTLYRSTILTAERIIVLSPAYAEIMAKRLGIPNNKMRVIPNAIDATRYKIRGTDKPFRQKHRIPLQKPIVLYVGALIQRKGVPTLLDAIPRMLKENSDLQFILIGRGPLQDQITHWIGKQGLASSVHMLGGVPDEDLHAAYRAARVVVLPTHADVAPTTILEALLFGKPVVSTTIPGIEDLFEDVALLVKPEDPEGLANAILKTLCDRRLSQSMSRKGKCLVKTSYRWEDRVDALASLYESLM